MDMSDACRGADRWHQASLLSLICGTDMSADSAIRPRVG